MVTNMFACLYQPPRANAGDPGVALAEIAREFSPRYEQTRGDLVTIDVSGLGRLLGPPAAIGAELARDASARGLRLHLALAATRTAAMVMALSRPGVTVVEAGGEAAALAPMPIDVLAQIDSHDQPQNTQNPQKPVEQNDSARSAISAVKHWGVRTLGELAALPPADLVSRLGRPALKWQAIARGEDIRPLVPALPEERFESSLELDWPIEGLEPLSFVLTRLLEPLSTRLERRDRGAAALHLLLRLVTREVHARCLPLPAPLRDVRTLRTLALLDLESHPPAAAIDKVTVVIDPTPGRVLQHTLFTRAHPTPERLSTLLARLGALMGQDRFGAAALVDSYRPGAFAMKPFATVDRAPSPEPRIPSPEPRVPSPEPRVPSPEPLTSVLRRCRQPVPARVMTERDRPVRVTADRGGFAGGSVTHAVGPWRTSGNWWAGQERLRPCRGEDERLRAEASAKARAGGGAPAPVQKSWVASHAWERWNRDEWDVSLSDGGVYRIFRDRDADAWFIDGIVD
jgi:protein ImuB